MKKTTFKKTKPIQMPYKIIKCDKQSLWKINECFGIHFFVHMLNKCTSTYAKYQVTSVKGLIQADVPMFALSKHKHTPYSKPNSN